MIIDKFMCAKSGLLVFLLFSFGCNQIKVEKIEFGDKIKKLVLEENNVGQTYFFKIPGTSILEYEVTYLGDIKTKQGKILKFENFTCFTGLYTNSRRANSALYLLDSKNEIIGHYYVGGNGELPSKVINGKVLFNLSYCKIITEISFVDSIPESIYVPCDENRGDVHNFSNRD